MEDATKVTLSLTSAMVTECTHGKTAAPMLVTGSKASSMARVTSPIRRVRLRKLVGYKASDKRGSFDSITAQKLMRSIL